jgi:hypothetical protein
LGQPSPLASHHEVAESSVHPGEIGIADLACKAIPDPPDGGDIAENRTVVAGGDIDQELPSPKVERLTS